MKYLREKFCWRGQFFWEGLTLCPQVLEDPGFWKIVFTSREKAGQSPPFLRATSYLLSIFREQFLHDGIFSLPLEYYGKRFTLYLPQFTGKIIFKQILDLWFPYLDKERKALLYPEVTPEDIGSPFHTFYFNPKREISWGSEGPYENGYNYLREGDYVLDVGAYVGVFTLLAGKVVGEKGRVFAFEPQPQFREMLEMNLELNGLYNVDVVPKALGDTQTTISMRGMLIKRTNQGYIECTTLDNWAKEVGLEYFDFLKMDVEGFERKVLRGGRKTLRLFTPRMGICTYHLPDDPQVLQELILDINPCYRIMSNVTGKKYLVWKEES